MYKKITHWFHNTENLITGILLFLMALLPALEIILRFFFKTGIAASSIYVQHLTLIVGFLGAIIATREKRHLTLSTGAEFLPKKLRRPAVLLTGIVSTTVTTGLFWASIQMLIADKQAQQTVANWIPLWMIEAIIPVCFTIITIRFIISTKGILDKIITSSGILIASIFGLLLFSYVQYFFIPSIIILIISVIFGTPIFIALGGIALILFFNSGVPVASLTAETYRIVASPIIPTIPLFTLAGYILAEGGTSRRMIRLFKALFSWMPGGLAIASILVCTFFTTFTGASGVTILAVGGVLLPILLHNGYKKDFSIGLLTSTGSLGLLFPPSLPIILYGVFSHTSIADLFKGGILPGLILVIFVSIFSIREGIKNKAVRVPFNFKEAVSSLWESKWEAALPFIVLLFIFGGFCTIVEAAAVTVIYAFIIESFIYKDINIFRDFPGILLKCSIVIGGVLIILGSAMGLTNFIVDAEIPMIIADWTKANIHSPLLFLLILNIVLLVVGCLMDIISALVVVVPLITPIGAAFGIDPVHLGIIFIANLELGYLTPPVGMNLFLSAYRFNQPVSEVVRNSFRFLILLLIAVLIITYCPILTTGMVKLLQ